MKIRSIDEKVNAQIDTFYDSIHGKLSNRLRCVRVYRKVFETHNA